MSNHRISKYRINSFIKYDLRISKDDSNNYIRKVYVSINESPEKEIKIGDTIYISEFFKKHEKIITFPSTFQGILNFKNNIYLGYETKKGKSMAYIELKSFNDYLKEIVELEYLGNSSYLYENKINQRIFLERISLFKKLVKINNITLSTR